MLPLASIEETSRFALVSDMACLPAKTDALRTAFTLRATDIAGASGQQSNSNWLSPGLRGPSLLHSVPGVLGPQLGGLLEHLAHGTRMQNHGIF